MFENIRKWIAISGILLFLIILILPAPAQLAPEGKKALAVFILCLALWVSQLIPLPVTALLGIGLMPLLGILGLEETFSLFGNKAIFFILGALILAGGLYQTGLGSRMAFHIISFFGGSPRKLLLGVLFSSSILACIMPEHAVAALMFPIVVEIAGSLNLKPLQSNFGKYLFLTMAWGTVTGGITTYLGGARNLLAVGLLEEKYNMTIGFFEWISYSWPIPFLILLIYAILIIKVFKIELKSVDRARRKLSKKMEKTGSMSKAEKKLGILLLLVIFSWMFLSNIIHISVTAVLGGVFTFAIGIIDWDEIEQYVNWGVLLMYGGAIVVASSLVETGVTEWLADIVFSGINVSPFVFLAGLAFFTTFLTEGVSNVAAVAVILPLAYSIGDVYQIHPILITLSVALPGGLAFMLPMGTPPNAIAFSAGYYRIEDAIILGLMLKLIGWIIFMLVARFYWPLLGL